MTDDKAPNLFDTMQAHLGERVLLQYRELRPTPATMQLFGRLVLFEGVRDQLGHLGVRIGIREGLWRGGLEQALKTGRFHVDWRESSEVTTYHLGPFGTVSTTKAVARMKTTRPDGSVSEHEIGAEHVQHMFRLDPLLGYPAQRVLNITIIG